MKKADINEWMTNILENSFDGIYITDSHAKTIFVNKSYEAITGLDRKELLNHDMNELVKKQVISASGTLMVLKTGRPVTLQQEFKTGKRALITSSPVFGSDHQIALVVTNVRDLTEIYNLKVELKKNSKQQTILQKELEHMKRQFLEQNIVAEDMRTLETLRLVDKVKRMDTTVTLVGETGVGKEVFAKYIHQGSARSSYPFIKVNCGAIPENLMESEFFGYEKGAFTGADRNGKAGLFEVADKGTIFLDEVGELPLNMQVKLLRVLQEQEIKRVGGVKPVHLDVRILAATNQNLEKMLKEGKFREDLYYRLMVFPICVPPLRERAADIPGLAELYLRQLNSRYGSDKKFSREALQILLEYPWPGNIRELKNVVERAYILSGGDWIVPGCLSILQEHREAEQGYHGIASGYGLSEYLERLEQKYIQEAYRQYGNIRDAAASLGMAPATFARKRSRYDKDRTDAETDSNAADGSDGNDFADEQPGAGDIPAGAVAGESGY